MPAVATANANATDRLIGNTVLKWVCIPSLHMARKPENKPIAASADDARTLLGEPRFTESMTLIETGGTVVVTIPHAARQFFGYEVGEERTIEVYDDGVFVPVNSPVSSDDDIGRGERFRD